MHITQLDSQLLRLPLARPIATAPDGDRAGRLDHIFMLIVYLLPRGITGLVEDASGLLARQLATPSRARER